MNIIDVSLKSGCIQSWEDDAPIPEGYAIWADGLEMDTYLQYMGFIILEIVDGVVVSYTPDIEAYNEYIASLPPEPEPEVNDDDLANAILEGVNAV